MWTFCRDDVWVTANFKETQLARLRPGQPVEVNVDAYGRKWKGRIAISDPTRAGSSS